jgi:hypothetical protein
MLRDLIFNQVVCSTYGDVPLETTCCVLSSSSGFLHNHAIRKIKQAEERRNRLEAIKRQIAKRQLCLL